MNSENNLSNKLENTWNYNLMEMIEQARSGDFTTLNSHIREFAPLAAVNADNSILLTLRKFDSKINGGKISVLNCAPEGENYQWGITITRISDSATAQNNIFLPNTRKYSGLKILGNEVQIFMDDAEPVTSNIFELQNKLEFWEDFTEQELENAFSSLSNIKSCMPSKNKALMLSLAE